MICWVCERNEPENWLIYCNSITKTGEREFTARPTCGECSFGAWAGLVPADKAKVGEEVAIYKYTSGPPDL